MVCLKAQIGLISNCHPSVNSNFLTGLPRSLQGSARHCSSVNPFLAFFLREGSRLKHIDPNLLSSPRAESARAVTGRQCPHSGKGKTF